MRDGFSFVQGLARSYVPCRGASVYVSPLSNLPGRGLRAWLVYRALDTSVVRALSHPAPRTFAKLLNF